MCNDRYGGSMKIIPLLILLTVLKTDLFVCFECNIQECTESTDWQDQLMCYCEKIQTKIKSRPLCHHVNCSWQPDFLHSESTGYKLHLLWFIGAPHKNCTFFSTKRKFVEIGKANLRMTINATVWVTRSDPNQTCSRTKPIYIIPTNIVKCDPPDISVHQLLNKLIIERPKTKTVLRYREISSFDWKHVNLTHEVLLPDAQQSSTFSAQVRCIPDESCFHCDWGKEIVIIHKLTERPRVTSLTSEALSPGRQTVAMSWEISQSSHVEGYNITIERMAKNPKIQPNSSFKVTNSSLKLSLSMSCFRISIFAYNKVGDSPIVSEMVPQPPLKGLPGQLFATSTNGTVFLTWVPLITVECFLIEYGLNYSEVHVDFVRQKSNYTLAGPFEVGRQYIILLHTLSMCQAEKNDSTFGVTYVYPIEDVPSQGPTNISIENETIDSAVVKWSEIPENGRKGVLRGYRIYYTEMATKTTKEIYVNSSTRNSYKLKGLSEDSVYTVQISGITNAGEGAQSPAQLFKTANVDQSKMRNITMGVGLGTLVLICTCLLILKRAWSSQSVPNPGDSNAIQSIERRVPEAQEEHVSREGLLEETSDSDGGFIVEEDSNTNRMFTLLMLETKDLSEENPPTGILYDTQFLNDSYIPEETIVSKSPGGQNISREPNALLMADYTTMCFIQEVRTMRSDVHKVKLEMIVNTELAQQNQPNSSHDHKYVKQCQIEGMVFKYVTNPPAEQSFQVLGCPDNPLETEEESDTEM